MRWPLKYIYITQEWGVNPSAYARFGLKGHNGIDFRAAVGTPVYAPHDGKIKEKANDTNGYGLYLKVESDVEGSVLGHFSKFAVNLGQEVKEGDLLGYSGNTGNSTGPHLHWGYYKHPRNRGDGYGGFINQKGLISSGDEMSKELEACMVDRQKFWDERDATWRELDADSLEGAKRSIAGLRSRITDLSNQLGGFKAEVDNQREKVSRLQVEIANGIKKLDLLEAELKSKEKENEELAQSKGLLAIENAQLKEQVETLKQQIEQGEFTLSIKEVIQLILKQKITFRR